MQLSPIGLSINDLDTPALLLDLDALEHNVTTMARHFRDRGVEWRPHAKAFKCPAIAHMLRRAGAIGVTVAKVSEAEVMAAGGIEDILIAHLAPLGQAAREAGTTIGVLVDIDLGMKRTGVATAEAAVELAQLISSTSGLRFDGLMGYEGHTLMIADPVEKRGAITAAIGKLIRARDAVETAGLQGRI